MPGCLWIHAVSVGEVQAAIGLIQSLRREFPEVPVVVSTVTPTGAQRVRSFFGESVRHCYLPYDLPGSVRRFLDRLQPRVAIILETEIWPTLYHELGRQAYPARARERARLDPLGRSLSTDGVAVQGDAVARHPDRRADRRGRRALQGRSAPPPERVRVTGNVKFDMEIPAASIAAGPARFATSCGPDDRCGSRAARTKARRRPCSPRTRGSSSGIPARC